VSNSLADDFPVNELPADEPARVQQPAIAVARRDPALGDRDEPLDERAQLFRLGHGRFDVLVAESAPSPGSAASQCDESVTRPNFRCATL
jgi:hypothetical protein